MVRLCDILTGMAVGSVLGVVLPFVLIQQPVETDCPPTEAPFTVTAAEGV